MATRGSPDRRRGGLARKSIPRLEAILDLHAAWRAEGKTAGVIYVCATKHGSQRVVELARKRDLTYEPGGGLRVELLEHITRQARDAGEQLRAARRQR